MSANRINNPVEDRNGNHPLAGNEHYRNGSYSYNSDTDAETFRYGGRTVGQKASEFGDRLVNASSYAVNIYAAMHNSGPAIEHMETIIRAKNLADSFAIKKAAEIDKKRAMTYAKKLDEERMTEWLHTLQQNGVVTDDFYKRNNKKIGLESDQNRNAIINATNKYLYNQKLIDGDGNYFTTDGNNNYIKSNLAKEVNKKIKKYGIGEKSQNEIMKLLDQIEPSLTNEQKKMIYLNHVAKEINRVNYSYNKIKKTTARDVRIMFRRITPNDALFRGINKVYKDYRNTKWAFNTTKSLIKFSYKSGKSISLAGKKFTKGTFYASRKMMRKNELGRQLSDKIETPYWTAKRVSLDFAGENGRKELGIKDNVTIGVKNMYVETAAGRYQAKRKDAKTQQRKKQYASDLRTVQRNAEKRKKKQEYNKKKHPVVTQGRRAEKTIENVVTSVLRAPGEILSFKRRIKQALIGILTGVVAACIMPFIVIILIVLLLMGVSNVTNSVSSMFAGDNINVSDLASLVVEHENKMVDSYAKKHCGGVKNVKKKTYYVMGANKKWIKSTQNANVTDILSMGITVMNDQVDKEGKIDQKSFEKMGEYCERLADKSITCVATKAEKRGKTQYYNMDIYITSNYTELKSMKKNISANQNRASLFDLDNINGFYEKYVSKSRLSKVDDSEFNDTKLSVYYQAKQSGKLSISKKAGICSCKNKTVTINNKLYKKVDVVISEQNIAYNDWNADGKITQEDTGYLLIKGIYDAPVKVGKKSCVGTVFSIAGTNKDLRPNEFSIYTCSKNKTHVINTVNSINLQVPSESIIIGKDAYKIPKNKWTAVKLGIQKEPNGALEKRTYDIMWDKKNEEECIKNKSLIPWSSYGVSAGNADNYIDEAKQMADDDTIGYSMNNRCLNPDVDCSSFVYYSLINSKTCSKKQLGSGPFSTADEPQKLKAAGFMEKGFNKNDLEPGDILWYPKGFGGHSYGHTEIYIGNNKTIGAHSNYDQKNGDSSGKEVCIVTLTKSYAKIFRKTK